MLRRRTAEVSSWRKAFTWAGAITFVFVGSRLPLAGVNVEQLFKFTAGSKGGLLGLYEMVFQGGLPRGAILGLGIMPYVAARLYMWLWRFVNPEATVTRTKTRLLTAALSVIASLA